MTTASPLQVLRRFSGLPSACHTPVSAPRPLDPPPSSLPPSPLQVLWRFSGLPSACHTIIPVLGRPAALLIAQSHIMLVTQQVRGVGEGISDMFRQAFSMAEEVVSVIILIHSPMPPAGRVSDCLCACPS